MISSPSSLHFPSLEPDGASIDEQLAWARQALTALPQPEQGGQTPAEVVLRLVDRLEAMLEHTTDMITVLGPEGDIRYSNRAAGVLTGYTDRVNGSGAIDFVHPDDTATVLATFGACLERDGAIAQAEFRIRHSDGSWHYVEAYARNCLADPVAGVVVSMRDICARKRSEDALLTANESMREFVAVVSHELRTPTSVVNGFASGLVRNWERMKEEDRREAIDTLARSAKRLTILVEDLLTLSALDAGAPFPAMTTTELGPIVEETLEDLGADGFEVAIPPGTTVAAGRRELGRVLRNYVENALRYGAAPFLIDATLDGDNVVVRVRDHGEGVAEPFVERLFERFARADSSRSRQTGGTGLGLSIVQALANGWGGEAWFEPNQPRGACFAVRIPMAGSD